MTHLVGSRLVRSTTRAIIAVGAFGLVKTSTNTVVVKTVTVGSNPHGVAITSNGRYAYVANGGSGTVSVIKTSTEAVVDTVTVGDGPAGVAIT